MQIANVKKSSREDWHPADIVAALRKSGYTLSKLAFECGLRDSSGLSVAMIRSFPKGEQRIAKALGIHPKVIWPSRYNDDGTRKPTGLRALHITREMRERKATHDQRCAAIRASVAAGGGARNGWGANGFFLPFDDVTSATTIGYDRSQSDADTTGNNWTSNNISLTAGNTYDSTLDTPTSVFCTWNPLVPGDSVKSNGNLNATGTARGTMNAGVTPSQWEITANAAGVVGGVISESGSANTVAIPNGSTYSFRLAAGVLEFTTNGSLWSGLASGLTGMRLPYASGGDNTLNCGQRSLAYLLSAGFMTLCTKNLPLSGGTVPVSGTFTGNVSADGPFIFCNGTPETLTINGNLVTFGTHADRLSNGFKLRTASASYNSSGTNTWAATLLSPQQKSTFRYQNAKGNS